MARMSVVKSKQSGDDDDDDYSNFTQEPDFTVDQVDEYTNLRSRTSYNNLTDRNRSRSNHQINILRANPNYLSTASMDDNHMGGGSVGGSVGGSAPVDYETLLTLALENTSLKVDRENKKRQNTLFIIIGITFFISACILTSLAFKEYPAQNELHSEINNLEKDIDELHGQVLNIEKDEDIDLLEKDIDDKNTFIHQLENDENIDPKERATLVKGLQQQIDDLKVVVQELQADSEQKNENQDQGSRRGGSS